MKKDFDYIIAGSGCAGLSLAVRIAGSKELAGKKVLIVDKQPKNQNDWQLNDLQQTQTYRPPMPLCHL